MRARPQPDVEEHGEYVDTQGQAKAIGLGLGLRGRDLLKIYDRGECVQG